MSFTLDMALIPINSVPQHSELTSHHPHTVSSYKSSRLNHGNHKKFYSVLPLSVTLVTQSNIADIRPIYPEYTKFAIQIL